MDEPVSHVLDNGVSSGLTLNLHPLAILNISDHVTRDRLTGSKTKITGALLGTQANRQVAVVNTFELALVADVDEATFDQDFLERRKEQFKQVFPTLDVIGWYSVGATPSDEDLRLQEQFSGLVETPIFLQFNTDIPAGAKDLPLTLYESALSEGKDAEAGAKFVKLDYGVETGEAERIAVDGAQRGGMGARDESQVVGSLVTQRNAIRMLYERIEVLSSYVHAVSEGKAKADHNILRQISALLASLPTMDAAVFKAELEDEYADVQIADTFNSLTKQLNALSDYTDRHHVVFPTSSQDDYGPPGARGGKGFDRPEALAGGRRRR
ncbi:uncharacterized protein MKK02DRAFT_45203 [Dioszegia hungarica]|uniref:COP9 signalosome complex subunit 6 n=1 Tax=Dioszegia hungarica TaxID=4972 RepID=A0AA38HBC4_9TREE|nr:uncharacterized protein MKK02DRAFT_45203 [Dioszegia hungarica]KAI9636499.1 hypothetical protein MKK02DRAFT_45203 [Dioszegia hungarica]